MARLNLLIRDAIGVGLLGLVLIAISFHTYHRLRPLDQPDHPLCTGMADFQDVVYYPAQAALAGVSPYDSRPKNQGGAYFASFPAGNNFPLYAPLLLVLSLPLAVLPLNAAILLYGVANVGLLILFACVVLRLNRLPINAGSVGGLAALLLASRPGQANFYFGAITLPMALAALGSWSLAKTRPLSSALLLALSLVKPTFGGPLTLLMFSSGRHKPALLGLLVACVLNGATLALLLPHELRELRLLRTLAANQSVTEADPAVHPRYTRSRLDLPLVVERLGGERAAAFSRYGLPLLILAVSGYGLHRLSVAPRQRAVDVDSGEIIDLPDCETLSIAMMCLSVIVCIYHNIYDGLLVTPAVLFGWRLIAHGQGRRVLGWTFCSCAMMPALNFFSSKQFMALLESWLPASTNLRFDNDSLFWTPVATLNGICLAVAWFIAFTWAVGRRCT